MLKDITIGQYFPGTSLIHKLDPRIKIIIVALFIASLFFVVSFTPYIFIVLFIGLVIYVARLPLKFIIKGLFFEESLKSLMLEINFPKPIRHYSWDFVTREESVWFYWCFVRFFGRQCGLCTSRSKKGATCR